VDLGSVSGSGAATGEPRWWTWPDEDKFGRRLDILLSHDYIIIRKGEIIMPNWCRNTLWVSHENKDRLTELRVAIAGSEMCNFVLPEPDYKTTPVAHTFPEIQARFAKTEEEKAKAIANEPTIREDSWYDWRVQNWGTKWDIDMTGEDIHHNDDGSFSISFDSAWSPPIGVFNELIEMGFKIQAEWYESGMCFGGILTNDEQHEFNIPDGKTATEIFNKIKKQCKEDKAFDAWVEDWGIYDEYDQLSQEEQEEKVMESTS